MKILHFHYVTELGEIVDKKAEYMLSIYNEIQNIVFDLK